MKSKLEILVGLSVTDVLKIHDYVQLFFEQDITLNIYNDYRPVSYTHLTLPTTPYV